MTNDRDIRIEELLLIKLCRLEFDDNLKGEIQSICRGNIDWGFFSLAANKHGVSALVYNNLESLDPVKSIPSATAEFLRNASFMSMARNAGNMRVMEEVLGYLDKENIRIVLLKGMALELMVYGNKGIRQMTDADVLTGKNESMKAFRILKNKGFRPLPVKSVFHKLIINHIGKHLPSLIRNDSSIEIHHELFGREKSHLTSILLQTSKAHNLNGQTAYLPEPGILFLYLVSHLHKHELLNDSQLRLYTDLVVLIGKYGDQIINTELLSRAAEAGIEQAMADKLLILRQYWQIIFPGWLNEFIDSKAGNESISRFKFFLRSPKDNPATDRSGSYRPLLREIPGLHRKIIYVVGDLFPTLRFMKSRYHCRSSFKAILHYPHRLGKLVWLFRK